MKLSISLLCSAQRIPFHDKHERSENFKTPIMYGAAFAISAKFYWELQPDSGLKIYGGDQLEMSFKINLCGGELYEAPCSRVAHLYRRCKFPIGKFRSANDFSPLLAQSTTRNISTLSTTKEGEMIQEAKSSSFNFFSIRNNKRVAEIWLDEYKKYLYLRHPERYRNLDIGDISRQLALKKYLQCKPFSYYFDKIAPDSLKRFPLEEYVNFASGTVSYINTSEANLII